MSDATPELVSQDRGAGDLRVANADEYRRILRSAQMGAGSNAGPHFSLGRGLFLVRAGLRSLLGGACFSVGTEFVSRLEWEFVSRLEWEFVSRLRMPRFPGAVDSCEIIQRPSPPSPSASGCGRFRPIAGLSLSEEPPRSRTPSCRAERNDQRGPRSRDCSRPSRHSDRRDAAGRRSCPVRQRQRCPRSEPPSCR